MKHAGKGVASLTITLNFLQVTKDGCPVIFHDNFIYTEENVRRLYHLHSASSSSHSHHRSC